MQDNADHHNSHARKKQQALQYVLERDQWSSGVQQRCLQQTAADVERLRRELSAAERERDAARRALDQISAERDAAQRSADDSRRQQRLSQQQLETLQTSLAQANAKLSNAAAYNEVPPVAEPRPVPARCGAVLGRVALATVAVLAVGLLLTTTAVHDAQSHVAGKRKLDNTAMTALEAKAVVVDDIKTAGERKTQPTSGKRKTRFAAQPAKHRQWGPLLYLPKDAPERPTAGFDPLVKQIQGNLLTLGFDIGEADGFKGARTRLALDEFRGLYLSSVDKQPAEGDLAVIIQNYAGLARADAARFGVDQGVVAAIRLASVRTGVDFSYLMKLAAAESNFNPRSESDSSSATGLFQFTHDTWLHTLRKHGQTYGLSDYAAKIGVRTTSGGYVRPIMSDHTVYRHLLALRKNPRLSAMMAAESVRDNQARLAYSFDREPAQADLYLTHFLGADGAITFLKALQENPDAFAVDMFPEAARSNQGIFHPKTCNPRTVDEVYALFGEKFSTERYDDIAANN